MSSLVFDDLPEQKAARERQLPQTALQRVSPFPERGLAYSDDQLSAMYASLKIHR